MDDSISAAIAMVLVFIVLVAIPFLTEAVERSYLPKQPEGKRDGEGGSSTWISGGSGSAGSAGSASGSGSSCGTGGC